MNNKASLLEQIKAFFIKLFTVIVSFFHHLFHIDKKETKKQEIINKETNTQTGAKNPTSTEPITMPDDESVLSNPHSDGDDEAPNEVILELPISKIEAIKQKTVGTKKFIITKELIEELIEKAIEEIEEYKKIDFKVKKADKQTEEVIKEFKEKVIPKINHEIEKTKPKNEKELMHIVTDVVEEQNKLTPIIPPKKEVKDETKKENKADLIELDIDNDKKTDLTIKVDNKKKEPYFMANIIPETKLNLKTPSPVKPETKIAKTVPEVKEEIKDKADDVPVRMIKNTKDPLRPSVKEEIKAVAAVAAINIVKTAAEILTSTPTESKEKIKKSVPKKETPKEEIKEEVKEEIKQEPTKEEQKQPELKVEQPKPVEQTPTPVVKEEVKIKELYVPELKQIDDKIKESEHPKEMDVISEELAYIDRKIEDKKLEIKKVEEVKKEDKKEAPKEEVIEIIEEVPKEEPPKKEEPKKEIEFVDDYIIDEISEDINKATTKANEEMKKEDIEDKNYKDVEHELNIILKDIDNTCYKYKDTMPEIQLRKLEAQKAKIEQTMFSLDAQKKIDINNEKKHLEEVIEESEKEGLRAEIDRLNLQHRMELNDELVNRADKVTKESEEQLAVIEKTIIKRRLRDAYRHATITSMVALPFVRNRYFLFFTAGMMVKTFFLQLGHVLNRRKDDLSLPDINALKNGENALNEAINVTEENIDTLDYLTMETLTKYPELQHDREYVKYVNGLKAKLNQNYNKLTRKRDILDNTLHRSKRNIKILKKNLRKDQDRMAA